MLQWCCFLWRATWALFILSILLVVSRSKLYETTLVCRYIVSHSRCINSFSLMIGHQFCNQVAGTGTQQEVTYTWIGVLLQQLQHNIKSVFGNQAFHTLFANWWLTFSKYIKKAAVKPINLCFGLSWPMSVQGSTCNQYCCKRYHHSSSCDQLWQSQSCD